MKLVEREVQVPIAPGHINLLAHIRKDGTNDHYFSFGSL